MVSPGIPLTRPPQLDRALHATIGATRGTERNGMGLSALSMLARLPRAAAADSLAATIAGLPAESRPRAHARMVALCLVPLPPDQAHPIPDTTVASRPLDERRAVTLLAGATIRGIPQAGSPDATAGAAAAGRLPPVERTSWPLPGGP